jgi:hypothetical protein
MKESLKDIPVPRLTFISRRTLAAESCVPTLAAGYLHCVCDVFASVFDPGLHASAGVMVALELFDLVDAGKAIHRLEPSTSVEKMHASPSGPPCLGFAMSYARKRTQRHRTTLSR